MADEPRIAGVNWITVLVMWVYWGIVTSAMGRYAVDAVAPRATRAAPQGRRGLVGIAAFWILLLVVWGANLGPLPESGVAATALLAIIALSLLMRSAREPDADPARPCFIARFL